MGNERGEMAYQELNGGKRPTWNITLDILYVVWVPTLAMTS